jgi:ankyrin repeat protein
MMVALMAISFVRTNGDTSCDVHNGEFDGCDNVMLQQALEQAALSEDSVLLGNLIRHGVDLQSHGHRGQTPLIIAATSGKLHNVAKLLEQEVDMERRDTQGFTALAAAAQANKTDVVKLLIGSGALVDAKTADGAGLSALMAAAYMNNMAVIQLLLDSKATVNLLDNLGRTAVDYAMSEGNTAAAQKLIDSGGVSGATEEPFDFISDLMSQPIELQATLFFCTFFAFFALFYSLIRLWTTAKYRKILQDFYAVHSPEKVAQIEVILFAYAGREKLMMERIREKYLEGKQD